MANFDIDAYSCISLAILNRTINDLHSQRFERRLDAFCYFLDSDRLFSVDTVLKAQGRDENELLMNISGYLNHIKEELHNGKRRKM